MFKRKVSAPPLQRWSPPKNKVAYPKWTFVRCGDEYWIILDKTKVQFISERAFMSWGKVPVETTQEAISGYKTWKKVGFAPGTLIKGMDSKFYFITGKDPLATERRFVATPDFFNVLGFNSNNAIIVSNDEIYFHPEGGEISGI
jgi:hypothetical protein